MHLRPFLVKKKKNQISIFFFKILILNKEGIIEKNSCERRAYESVDEKSLY